MRELQKQLDKQNLISAEQSLAIQTDASKDDVMQNVNVLIKGTERQSEKSAETLVEEVRAPNAGRLPQSFIRDFEKKGTKGTSPPSSQDSYKNFLRKLRERGRNES